VEQVLDFFVFDEQFAVARDSELIAPGDPHTGKDVVDMGVDDR
jgi:hypothetical protein